MIIEKVCCREAFDRNTVGNLSFTLPNVMWDTTPMRVEASIAHDDENLYVAIRSYEARADRRITVTENEGPVWEDSCMELFFAPTPEVSLSYFNCEINGNGAIKFNFGEERHGRVLPKALPTDVKVTSTDEYWQLNYTIPYSVIREMAPTFTGASGSVMRGNMYRCGDEAKIDSLIALFKIDVAKPDYHRPEYFGEFVFA